MAALQGVDLDENKETEEQEEVVTVEQIQARAIARLTGNKDLAGAISQGFTPEMGVEYKIAEGTELG